MDTQKLNDDQRTWILILACWVGIPIASAIGGIAFGGPGTAYAALAVMAAIFVAFFVAER